MMMADPTKPSFSGLRVLIVEDAYLVALRLTRMVEDMGCTVVGPVPSVPEALALIDAGECDAAILDINLGDETAEPVADRLAAAGVPFFFVTGYASPSRLGPRFTQTRRIRKPIDPLVLETVMAVEFAGT